MFWCKKSPKVSSKTMFSVNTWRNTNRTRAKKTSNYESQLLLIITHNNYSKRTIFDKNNCYFLHVWTFALEVFSSLGAHNQILVQQVCNFQKEFQFFRAEQVLLQQLQMLGLWFCEEHVAQVLVSPTNACVYLTACNKLNPHFLLYPPPLKF